MKKKYCIYILLSLMVSLACRGQSVHPIVLIFNQPPAYPKRIQVSPKISILNTMPIINYYDGYTRGELAPAPLKTDTLTILPRCPYVALRHSFNTIALMDYLLQPGDTVVFNYINGIPHASLRGKQLAALDMAYENLNRQRAELVAGYTPYEIYRNPFFTKADIGPDPDMIVNLQYKIVAQNFQLAKDLFTSELLFLDSLKRAGQLSDTYYRFYSDRATYLAKTMQTEQAASPTAVPPLAIPPVGYFGAGYSFFYDYVQAYVHATLVRQSKIIHQSNGQIADFRQVYDSIAAKNALPQTFKDLLLHKYFALVADNFPKPDFYKYYAKAKTHIQDSALLADIANRYATTIYGNSLKKGAFLPIMDNNKTTTDLDKILAVHRDKVVYVDFWASWCTPCRAAMPMAAKLRQAYANKGVVFVYVSIDDDFIKWQKAAQEEGLAHYTYSYIGIKGQRSSLVQSIKLVAIPRYLIFSNGKLFSQNAPGPNAETALRKILDGLLKKGQAGR